MDFWCPENFRFSRIFKLKPKNKDNTTTRINNCEVLVKLMEANLLKLK